jgi:translation initiation factor 1
LVIDGIRKGKSHGIVSCGFLLRLLHRQIFICSKGDRVKKSSTSDAPLVWSSEQGRICPGCGMAVSSCICSRKAERPAGDGVVRVRRETKGRGGKTVTVVAGLPGDDAAIAKLAGELKRRCGTGGTVKDGAIEIQGDHGVLIVAELSRRGFTVKRSGG